MVVRPERVTPALSALHARVAGDRSGAVADYIPELARADPERLGIALAGMDGGRYEVGDAGVAFTIQSVSKPFVHALALADRGLAGVLDAVGSEPSGRAFNAMGVEPGTGRPANPMINAGAIATTALVRAGSQVERFERIRAWLSAFAGRELGVDEAVYRSEAETGDRNRALGYLVRAAGYLDGDVLGVVDTYFRQCAVLVTTVDLAVMGATLATGGRNPVTGEQVVTGEVAQHVLSVMATCGMYDYSGRWLLHVGMPAKSGVSGGLVAVSPGRFGVGVFSPRLDDRGNSVRGVAALKLASATLGLHLLHDPLRRDA